MMDGARIIAYYEAVSAITGQMLDAARNSNWDRLTELEKDCRSLMERLIAEDSGAPLSESLQRRKVDIIRKVLADDAEIRNVIGPWMVQLQQLLGSIGHEKKLQRAYDAGLSPGSGG